MIVYTAAGLLTVLFAGAAYCLASPALSLRSGGLWTLMLLTVLFFMLAVGGLGLIFRRRNGREALPGLKRVVGASSWVLTGLLAALIVAGLSGVKLFHAADYRKIAEARIVNSDFLTDVKEENAVSSIALMDTASAQIIGNRQLGSLNSLVSQFETSDYSTITVTGRPLKVSALTYADFFRYLRNRETGIPGYISVDPVTQKAQYVALDKPMKYVPGAYFGHDLKRLVHSRYPSAIVTQFYFELDEEGNPYYICPYFVYRAGVFGAKDVGGVILADPVTGGMERYALADVPRWIDRVFDGDLLSEQYNWYGTLRKGFWNSLLSKVGCVVTTDDYGYKSFDDDLWVFTGVTSVSSDESNVGFVLMNSRTGSIHYYDIYGAEEYSAMSAAEGQVQNLRYTASFPSVINVGGEPVYIMVLKDSGGLTKMYALVNVKDYSIVATGETQQQAVAAYREKTAGSAEAPPALENRVTVTVEEVRFADRDGETYAYLLAQGKAYRLAVKDDERVMLARGGDTVELLCGDTSAEVVEARLTSR